MESCSCTMASEKSTTKLATRYNGWYQWSKLDFIGSREAWRWSFSLGPWTELKSLGKLDYIYKPLAYRHTVLSVKYWTYYGLPTDERMCIISFNGIQTSIALSNVKEFQQPSFVRRVMSIGKILPIRIPLGRFEFIQSRDKPSSGKKYPRATVGSPKW